MRGARNGLCGAVSFAARPSDDDNWTDEDE